MGKPTARFVITVKGFWNIHRENPIRTNDERPEEKGESPLGGKTNFERILKLGGTAVWKNLRNTESQSILMGSKGWEGNSSSVSFGQPIKRGGRKKNSLPYLTGGMTSLVGLKNILGRKQAEKESVIASSGFFG